jgi:glycosyltransferase involved in cell wall biosynthesis
MRASQLFQKSFRKAKPNRIITEDIVVIDSALPNKNPIGPRNADLLEFAKQLPGFKYYTLYPMQPGPEAWFSHGYGMAMDQFKENLKAYLKLYPEAKGKIKYLQPEKKYRINLAYTYFLAETYTMLPFLEKNNIPFVFLLNPGGAFGIDNEASDNMLRRIFASPCFRKVIVNQRLFEKYLINKKLCAKDDVVYDFTGSVQFSPDEVVAKQSFQKDKKTFDVCFVAAKYSPLGKDKGYDLFIAAAKRLAKFRPDIRFHVVGGFDEHDIDVSDIKNAITFYGYLPSSELPKFYARMDIYLSPNRPFMLYEGNSDGFPLSAGAMYCGVCGFNSDELNMNTEFKENETIIVKTQVKDIVDKVKYYYSHLDELYEVSKKGQARAQFLYDTERHIHNRIKLLKEIKGVHR